MAAEQLLALCFASQSDGAVNSGLNHVAFRIQGFELGIREPLNVLRILLRQFRRTPWFSVLVVVLGLVDSQPRSDALTEDIEIDLALSRIIGEQLVDILEHVLVLFVVEPLVSLASRRSFGHSGFARCECAVKISGVRLSKPLLLFGERLCFFLWV